MSTLDRFFCVAVAIFIVICVRILSDVGTQLSEIAYKNTAADERLSQLEIATTSHDAEIRHLSKAIYEGSLP